MTARRPDLRSIIALGALALVIVAILLFWFVDRGGREVAETDLSTTKSELRITEDNAGEIATKVQRACERNGQVAKALGDTCRQAEEVAEKPTEPIAAGPSDEQVNAAVSDMIDEAFIRFCAANPDACEGDDAPRVSDTQLAAIVAAYCAGDACKGDNALALTGDQVVAGVASYCADNDCFPDDGEDGESTYQIWLSLGNTGTETDFIASLKGVPGKDAAPAKDGKDGADGISITDVDLLCDNPDQPIWRTHFSNGSFEDEVLPRQFCRGDDGLPIP